ncbi:hypothetical protein AB0G49_13775 [Streptomyces longwoodensis]|uniref:hypothetical protein n=1 Tax=Streptomyces longwoodensis TaxID=68231 RepID=UPI0033DF83E3
MPRTDTEAERERAEIALRIVADIARLSDLSAQDPSARIRCTPAVRSAAEDLHTLVDQAALRTGDEELAAMLARAPRPEG